MKYKMVIIGASTGGPKALKQIISHFPNDFPLPILIVLHIPPSFEQSLQAVLGAESHLPVHVIENDMKCEKGSIYIVPGGFHCKFEGEGKFKLVEDAGDTRFAPSLDVSILAAHEAYGEIIPVVLTGQAVGSDGVEACKKLSEKKLPVIIQDAKSSEVYGMPKNIKENGYYSYELPLEEIPGKVLELIDY